MCEDTSKLSVIIPHYSDLRGLDRCLRALECQSLDRNLYEVVVGDNLSPEGRAEVEAVVNQRAKLVVVTERGAGPARNGAADASSGKILAFVDSDCVPDRDWLQQGILALTSYGFVGGQVTVLVNDPANMSEVEAFETVFAFNFLDYITRKGFTGSGNMFVRRADFERVGGFRTGVSEDVDWSRRACSQGLSLGYASLAIVGHPARKDWVQLITKWRRIHEEMYRLASTTPQGRVRWLLRTWLMPFSAVWQTYRVLASDRLPNWRSRIGALRVLYRLRLWRFVDGQRLFFSRGKSEV